MQVYEFNGLVPELYVSDYKRSLDFYLNVLNFKLEYDRTEPDFAVLSYAKAQLMIQQQMPADTPTGMMEKPYGRGINFHIRTEELDAIIARLAAAQYPLRRGVEESWRKSGDIVVGEKEIHVLDLDGYFLRFSQVIGTRAVEE